MHSSELDMLQDEIPLEDLKIMGVFGAIKRGATKAEALNKYGITEVFYDANYERVMSS